MGQRFQLGVDQCDKIYCDYINLMMCILELKMNQYRLNPINYSGY